MQDHDGPKFFRVSPVMLADLNAAILIIWLIAELVPLIANVLAELERRPPIGRGDD